MSYWPTCPTCEKGNFLEKSEEGAYEEDDRIVKGYRVTYDCGHSVFITQIPDPLLYIDYAIVKKRWFEGIILSCAFFERLSLEIILRNMESKGETIDKEKLTRMSLMDLIIILFSSNLIDQPTYTRMIEIKKERDNLVHATGSPVIKPFYLLFPEKGKMLLNKAKKVFEFLLKKLEE